MIRRIALVLALCAAGARGEDAGNSVVVLINAASPDSESIGRHYAELRGVPEANICRVRCTTSEVISPREFHSQIREPLRKHLVEKKLAQDFLGTGHLALKVKYLVSTYGVPVKVREDYRDAKLDEVRHRGVRRTAAAVDSELALIALPAHAIKGWIANPLYKAGDAAPPVLFATRLDGPTPEIAKGLVDAAIAAEQNGLLGIAYIDTQGLKNGAYKEGDDWLLASAAALKDAGFFTRVDRSPETLPPDMPMPDAAFYLGWYSASLCGPMAKDGFRFRPGAVAYHIHSGSAAQLRSSRVGWAGPLLARGAAATMGAVFEPYLPGTVDAGEFARLFLSGKTFGESAVRATPFLSWMMTYVGDPLYAPFRADRLKAALDAPRNRTWRDVHDVVTATREKDFATALKLCAAHESEPLFVELAGRATFYAGRPAEAMILYRKLGGMAKDVYSSVQAYSVAADWLAGAGSPEPAMGAYLECIRAHPRSPHVLTAYRKALDLARGLRATETDVALLEGLAANFADKAPGRLAAGELHLRGLRKECPVPRVDVPRAKAGPAIDGQPADPAWKAGTAIELPAAPGRPGGGTTIRLLFNDSALYVLAEMRTDPGHAVFTASAPSDEVFELTLSPARDAEHSVRIAIPREGRASVPLNGVVWRSGAIPAPQGAVKVPAGWFVELEIPFAALGLRAPPKNTAWTANFVEKCSVPRFPFRMVPSFSSWALPDSDPLEPDCAGFLVFQ